MTKAKTNTDMVHPFSNGTEADYWEFANCEQCYRTQHDDPDKMPSCPIAAAICEGRITGVVPLRIAKRAGWRELTRRWPSRCAEFNTVDPVRRKRDLELLAAWNAGEPIHADADQELSL